MSVYSHQDEESNPQSDSSGPADPTNLCEEIMNDSYNLYRNVMNLINFGELKPQCVLLVGEKSCGKSSVLNRLLNINIIPLSSEFRIAFPIRVMLATSSANTCMIKFEGDVMKPEFGWRGREEISQAVDDVLETVGDVKASVGRAAELQVYIKY